MNKMSMMTEMKVMNGLRYKGQPGYCQHWVPNLLALSTVLSPKHAIISKGHQPATWWQLILLDHFHQGKSSILFLLEYTLWIQIFLLCTQCLCQNYHPWSYRMPYLPSCIPYTVGSDLGIKFSTKQVQQWAYVHRIHRAYHVTTILKQLTWQNAAMTFWRLQFWVGDNTLQCWGNVLQKAIYVLNRHRVYSANYFLPCNYN